MKHKTKLSSYFILAKFVTDCLLIPCIIILAYILKFKLGWVFEHVFSVSWNGMVYKKAPINLYLNVLWLIVLVWLFTFYFSKVYRRFSGIMPEIEEMLVVIKGVSIATIEMMALSFVYKAFPESRYVVGYAWILGIITLCFSRFCLHRLELSLLKKGKGLKKTLIIGADETGQDMAERLILSPSWGYRYAGTLALEKPDYCHFHLRSHFQLLGTPKDFASAVSAHDIEAIFITTQVQKPLFDAITLFCNEADIELKWLPKMGDFPGISSVEDYDGLLFASCSFPREGLGQWAKRGLDILAACVLIVLLSPLLCLIACLIKTVSPRGPIFFIQERVGKHNTTFQMIKFRTMIPDAEKTTGPVMVNETQETRYIRYGDFLRKTSLDELPQLFNVLKGEMSIVGPRPERPYFVEKFSQDIPNFTLRHKVKGGITGWAQVNGRSVLTRQPQHKLRYDLYYIKNWSLLLDIKIILKTMMIVWKREEAY